MLMSWAALLALTAFICACYLLWAVKGGRWGWLALVAGPLMAQQGLPLGWGLLAIQPLLLLDTARSEASGRALPWLSLAVILQLVVMYWGSVFAKDMQPWWLRASALEEALRGSYLPTSLGHALGELLSASGLGPVLTRAVVVGQCLMPLAFVCAYWPWGLRLYPWVQRLALGFHLLIMLLFHIAPFSLACMALWLMLTPQTPAHELAGAPMTRPARLLAGMAMGVWAIGMVAGLMQLDAPHLRRWWVAQSWRIMQRPEPAGFTTARLPARSWQLLGEERWQMAAAWGLASTPNLREEWLRSACQGKADKVELIVGHSLGSTPERRYARACP